MESYVKTTWGEGAMMMMEYPPVLWPSALQKKCYPMPLGNVFQWGYLVFVVNYFYRTKENVKLKRHMYSPAQRLDPP